MVPEPEWAFWMDDANMSAAPDGARPAVPQRAAHLRRHRKEVKRFEPGDEVAPGITSIAAYGHTPGHAAFAVASGNQSMLVLSDTTNHPWLFVRNPEWQAIFDMDGPMAVDTRKRLLDRAAADRCWCRAITFRSRPPATSSRPARLRLVPVMWQPSL